MATIMVYGMIVYNVALNTGGVYQRYLWHGSARNAHYGARGLCAGILCGRKAGHRPGVHLYAPHGPPAVHYLCHLLMIVCIMCPVMSLVATLLFKIPALAHGCIPGAATSLWRSAGRCSTADHVSVLSLEKCSQIKRMQ